MRFLAVGVVVALGLALWWAWRANGGAWVRPPAPQVETPERTAPPATPALTGKGTDHQTVEERGLTEVLVTTPTGAPLDGAEVLARPDDGWDELVPPLRKPGVSARSDSEGRARLALADGAWIVRARHGSLHGAPAWIDVPHAAPVRLVLAPGVHLTVEVVDPEARPLEGVEVEETEWAAGWPVSTGPDGVADLGGVSPQQAFLRLRKPGWLHRGEWAERLHRHGPEHRLRYVLHRGASLALRTVEADGRTPLPRVDVWADHAKGRQDVTTDDRGELRLDGVLAPGRLILRATAPDGRQREETLAVPDPPADRELVLAFPPGTTWRGIVREATGDGKPIAGVRLYVPDPWGEYHERARSDERGRFEISPVPEAPGADSVRLLALAPGWAQEEDSLGNVAAPDEESLDRLDVRLIRTRKIRGIVRGPDGDPVAGAAVRLGGRDTQAFAALGPRTASAGTDGRFVLEDVPPWKSLVVLAEAPGLGTGWNETFGEEQDAFVDQVAIALPGAFRLDVPVVDDEGRAVEAAWLLLRWHVPAESGGYVHRQVQAGQFLPVEDVPRTGAVVETDGPRLVKRAARVDASTREIVVERACRVTGTLVDEQGKPIAGSWFRLGPVEHAMAAVLDGKTDAGGRFEVDGLPKGLCRIAAGKLTATVQVAFDGQDLGRVVVKP